MIKISVILTTYNSENQIQEEIASIHKQEGKDELFELEIFGFNNENFIIYERKIDGWIDAISLCKAGGNKEFKEWDKLRAKGNTMN